MTESHWIATRVSISIRAFPPPAKCTVEVSSREKSLRALERRAMIVFGTAFVQVCVSAVDIITIDVVCIETVCITGWT
jgi:hypothetical protein